MLRSKICDWRDWVRAGVVQRIGSENVDSICQITNDEELISGIEQWWEGYSDLAEAGKPFNKDMSPQTVIKLSDEWYERQAVKRAADVEFPEPWYDGGKVGDYQIEPIKAAPDLSRYAFRLHNCATSYAHKVARGKCFLYVVLQEDIPKAMVELKGDDKHARLSQLSGPCNEYVGEELETAVNTWFEAA